MTVAAVGGRHVVIETQGKAGPYGTSLLADREMDSFGGQIALGELLGQPFLKDADEGHTAQYLDLQGRLFSREFLFRELDLFRKGLVLNQGDVVGVQPGVVNFGCPGSPSEELSQDSFWGLPGNRFLRGNEILVAELS
jgi:hypothetical protein